MKPRALNPYCGVGGVTRGLQLAGFHVTGVDIAEQPDYCGDEFAQGDAVDHILAHGGEYDVICAEPPCQDHIAITAGNRGRPGWTDDHRNWIVPTREALAKIREATGVPTVIECGVGRHLRRDLMLCADMFYPDDWNGPRVQRHRYFEIDGLTVPQPRHRKHRGYIRGMRHGVWRDGPEAPYVAVYGEGGGKATIAEAQAAMGIDWTVSRHSLNEAVPVPYAQYVGRFLMAALKQPVAADIAEAVGAAVDEATRSVAA